MSNPFKSQDEANTRFSLGRLILTKMLFIEITYGQTIQER